MLIKFGNLNLYGYCLTMLKFIMKNSILFFLLIILSSIVYGNDDALFNVYNVRSQTDGSVDVYASNSYVCEESVLIEFTSLKNMKTEVELPFKGVVPAGAKEYKLFTLTIKDISKESQIGYIAKNCHGDIFTKKHDNNYIYTIPYAEGKKYPLDQGYGGKFSHYMEGKKHALDFVMDEGSEICAARGGVVVEVKDNSNKGGKSIKFQDYGNYITICHDDGTLANYYHLKKSGRKVDVGDMVTSGQLIALSGNTGWSSGPHLHFQVYSFTEELEVKSIPTKFLQEEGKAITLEKNRSGYVSVH